MGQISVQPGDPVRVKILEIDSERRRLSLSIKRVEGQVLPVRPIIAPTEDEQYDDVPDLGLSEDVFAPAADEAAAVEDAPAVEEAVEAPVDEAPAVEEAVEAPVDEAPAAEVTEVEQTPEAQAEAE